MMSRRLLFSFLFRRRRDVVVGPSSIGCPCCLGGFAAITRRSRSLRRRSRTSSIVQTILFGTNNWSRFLSFDCSILFPSYGGDGSSIGAIEEWMNCFVSSGAGVQ